MHKPTTREMSDAHEAYIAETFGGQVQRGSGNQFNRPMDVRHHPHSFMPMAFDGKSTLGKSVGVSREMWAKAVEQSHGLEPALPLRFYDDWRLSVGLDLVVVRPDFLAELHELAWRYDQVSK